jgi:3-deoxy-D-manno-octulosonate 8-phosphate phosphatase (KDO 8-P phosphatase)
MPTARATPDAFERARKIKLVLFDVDGVLTDGTIWVVPVGQAPSHTQGPTPINGDGGFGIESFTMAEMKGFSAHDGMGVSLAKVAGLEVGFITKRVSEAVKARARDLRINYLYTGQQRKMEAVRDIMEKSGFTLDQIAYAGDDIIDLPVMRQCGLAITVPNARPQVITAAHYISEREGGHGAGRDAVEFILKAKGILDAVIERYIDDSRPALVKNDIGTGNM